MDKLTLFFATLAAILIFTFGPQTPVAQKGVDPQLQSYVDGFTVEAIKYDPNFQFPDLNIDVGVLDAIDPFNDGNFKILGVCNMLTKDIIIDEWTMKNLSKEEKEQVIWHEFGHCVLNRGHQEGRAANGNPVSMMFPYMLDEAIYSAFHEYYIKELFLGPRVWPEFLKNND